jgi:tetratricopeptide (TPR) repeat protein
LIDYLLAHHNALQARSELLALLGDIPKDAKLIAAVAQRFQRAGDWENALSLYRQAIRLGASTPAVFAGAGAAAFQLRDYRSAVDFLDRAQEKRADGDVRTMEQTARAVLEIDPYARGLSHLTRVVRVLQALDLAAARLQSCSALPATPQESPAPPAPLMQQIQNTKRSLNRQPARTTPEQLDTAMDLVFQAEQNTVSCPISTPSDSALALIAQRRAQER